MILLTKLKTQIRQENDQFFSLRQARLLVPDADIFPPAERIDRIRYYADKPLEWMAAYMPDDFTSDFADLHPDMITYLTIRGRLVLIVTFRNSGKGSILKGFTAHCTCYGLEWYITRMEHDRDTAVNELLDLCREFRTNVNIIGDYGMLCGDAYGMPWRPGQGEVFFSVPKLPGIERTHEFTYIRYVGLKSLIRGTVTLNRKRIGRLIVNDPVKGYEEAHSAPHTVKTVHTIKSDAGFAGGAYTETPISVTIVGTCQARGDVIDVLQAEPMAKVLTIPAIQGEKEIIKDFMGTISEDIPHIRDFIDRIENEDHRNDTQQDHEEYIHQHWDTYKQFVQQLHPTWKARFTLADYVFIAANWGTDIFMQEEQHETIDVALQKFYDEWFVNYDGSVPNDTPITDRLSAKNHPLIHLMTVDVAGTPQEGSDPFAIYAGSFHKSTKNLYTRHFWCDQSTPEDLACKIYEIFWESFPWYIGKGVTIYLEDVVAFSGIGRAYLNIIRIEKIQQIRETWEEKILCAEEAGMDATALRHMQAAAKEAVKETKKYWRRLPIKLLIPASMGNKLGGIAALRPVAQHRQIWVNRRHSQQGLLVTQFTKHKGKQTHEKMPIEYKNDGPDTVRMVWHVLKKIHKIDVAAFKPFSIPGSGDHVVASS